MKKTIFALFLLSTPAYADNYKDKMDTFVNHQVDELVQLWGYPQASSVAPNGNNVYIYQVQETSYLASYRTSDSFATGNYTFGGQPLNWYCRTDFEVDSNKKIIRVTWQGNLCR